MKYRVCTEESYEGFESIEDCDTYHEALRELVSIADDMGYRLEPHSAQSWQAVHIETGHQGAVLTIRRVSETDKWNPPGAEVIQLRDGSPAIAAWMDK